MMQEPLSFAHAFSNVPGLPKHGEALFALRRLEHGYRELAHEHGFTEVNLPLVAPLARFRSLLTRENLLGDGPRFIDPQGLEWALRSDMTAFAVQFVLDHMSEVKLPARIAYAGKVFAYDKGTGTEQAGARHAQLHLNLGLGSDSSLESWEFGAEILGEGEIHADLEVLSLASATARRFGLGRLTLVVGDARIARALFAATETHAAPSERAGLLQALRKAFATGDRHRFDELFASHPFLAEASASLSTKAVDTFLAAVRERHDDLDVRFDPWSRRTQDFYSGITFEIFAQDAVGKLRWLGGGGRYDTYFSHFGHDVPAVGFMMKDPSSVLERDSVTKGATSRVRVALPKGRLLKTALAALAEVGIVPETDPEATRRLVIPSRCGEYEFLLVKNTDVGSYLDHGMADFAIVGSDVLDEGALQVVRPVTFTFGRCKICLAGKPGGAERLRWRRRPRVATKYERLAEEALRLRGLSFDVIPLQGSVELASVIDLADAIVDLVETGSTLRENGLVVYEDLGLTRVHLACTRGFHYLHGARVDSWRTAWENSGLVEKGTSS
ncbi:MAG: ATP phosphoribosyltransferase [Silvanigrellales bacterium]|nr:ATP phosphoribosyltransferase [Silvanigrellales bacterium]